MISSVLSDVCMGTLSSLLLSISHNDLVFLEQMGKGRGREKRPAQTSLGWVWMLAPNRDCVRAVISHRAQCRLLRVLSAEWGLERGSLFSPQ